MSWSDSKAPNQSSSGVPPFIANFYVKLSRGWSQAFGPVPYRSVGLAHHLMEEAKLVLIFQFLNGVTISSKGTLGRGGGVSL